MFVFFVKFFNYILEACGYDTDKNYVDEESYLDNKYNKYNKQQLKIIDEDKNYYTYHPIEF